MRLLPLITISTVVMDSGLALKRARPGMTRRYGVDVWLVPGVSLATGAMIWIDS